jgi:hypothetical protein
MLNTTGVLGPPLVWRFPSPTLDVILSADTRRLKVPPQFLIPGRSTRSRSCRIAENGNRTLAEGTFRVRE